MAAAPDSQPRSLRRNAMVSTATSVVRGLLAFGAALVITRGLSTQDRGAYSFITNTTTVLLMLGGIGIGSAMTRAKATGGTTIAQLYRAALTLGASIGTVGGALFLLAFAVERHDLFSGVTLGEALVVAAVVPPLLVLNHWTVVSYLEDRVAEVSTALTAGGVLFLIVVGVLAAVSSLTTPLVVIAWAVTSIAPLVVLVRLNHISVGFSARDLSAQLLRYGLRANVATVALILAWRIDVFLVKGYRGLVELGLYGVAVSLCEIMLSVALSLRIALTPLQGASSDRGRVVDAVCAVTRLTLVGGAATAGVIALVAHPLVVLLFGDRYAAAATAVRWLIPGIVTLVAQGPLIDFLLTEGKVAGVTMTTVAALAANVSLNLALLPHHTFVAAAVASTVTYVFSCGLILVLFVRASGAHWRHLVLPARGDLQLLSLKRRPPAL